MPHPSAGYDPAAVQQYYQQAWRPQGDATTAAATAPSYQMLSMPAQQDQNAAAAGMMMDPTAAAMAAQQQQAAAYYAHYAVHPQWAAQAAGAATMPQVWCAQGSSLGDGGFPSDMLPAVSGASEAARLFILSN